jgi:Rab-like protein 3
MTTLERVRILVLGDSGVGKTSLVHLLAKGQPLEHITYTIGASIEVKLHEYREGTPSQKKFWIGKFCCTSEFIKS